jgi:hypothetical protein
MRNLLHVILACALPLGISAQAQAQSDTLLTDVTIVDVAEGTLSAGQSVLIRDGLIAKVGEDIASETATPVNGAGGYLIPGLWDSHVHLFSSPTEPDTALPLYLINGVTGIRDMGALWPIAEQQALQHRIEAGEVLGPRLILAGAWVDASPGSWPGMFLADTQDEARDVVDRIAAEGFAAVKAYSMLDEATYLALAEAAHDAGLPFVGHIPERVALETAIDAGQDGMEHFGRVAMACSTAEEAMLDRAPRGHGRGRGTQATSSDHGGAQPDRPGNLGRGPVRNEVLARMVEADMHVSPTLVVADFYTGNWPAPDAPRMRMIPADVREAWGRPDFRLEAMTDEVRALAQDSIALDRRTSSLMAHGRACRSWPLPMPPSPTPTCSTASRCSTSSTSMSPPA